MLAVTVLAAGVLAAGCSSAPSPAPTLTAPTTTSSPPAAPTRSAGACVVAEDKPPPAVPWHDVEALCAAPHGTAWAPPRSGDPDQLAEAVQSFLRDERYKQLGWLHDADWRLTGRFDGCACPDGTANGCVAGVNKGPHPAVRIYYSPEVIDWMCKYRRGDNEAPDAPPVADGGMIIKEMMSPAATRLALVPGSNRLWIAPIPGKPADYYDRAFESWTVIVKDRAASADGWYWAFYDKTSPGNPPIWDRCAFTQKPYPGMDGAPVTAPPGCQWLPTYWDYTVNDQQYPNAQFGNYCVYCHASAQGQSTFASFVNLMGTEIQYPWRPSAEAETEVDTHTHALRRRAHNRRPASAAATAGQCPGSPFASPAADALPGWTAAFPEL
ncbi:MAG TPA: hypothetical protein VLM79_25645, partial [Kofleriaceae bacterium]|nr:hypothetical protein [Kofleriaceae bacterium]